jgi:hypothetical protein
VLLKTHSSVLDEVEKPGRDALPLVSVRIGTGGDGPLSTDKPHRPGRHWLRQ